MPSFQNGALLDLVSGKMLETTCKKMNIEGIKLGFGIAEQYGNTVLGS